MILSDVPVHDWPMLRVKVAAGEELMGKRKDWGQNRRLWNVNSLFGVSQWDMCTYLIVHMHVYRRTFV